MLSSLHRYLVDSAGQKNRGRGPSRSAVAGHVFQATQALIAEYARIKVRKVTKLKVRHPDRNCRALLSKSLQLEKNLRRFLSGISLRLMNPVTPPLWQLRPFRSGLYLRFVEFDISFFLRN